MDTRQEILAAAAKVFAQHGFRGSTTRRIADAAGVNEVTLFRYFGSKNALLREAISSSVERPPRKWLPDIPVDPERELTAWSESVMDHLNVVGPVIRTCMGEIEERPEMIGCVSTGPRVASRELCNYLTALKGHGLARSDFDPLAAAAMLMGAIFSDAMGRSMMPEVYPEPQERAASMYTQLLLKAIAPEPVRRKSARSPQTITES